MVSDTHHHHDYDPVVDPRLVTEGVGQSRSAVKMYTQRISCSTKRVFYETMIFSFKTFLFNESILQHFSVTNLKILKFKQV